MNRIMRVLEAALILLFLSSCYMFGPADDGFRVSGTVQSSGEELPNDCFLELRSKENKPFYGPVPTKSGQFGTQFLVAPYKADYWLVISCAGYEAQRVLVGYGTNTSPSKPLKLGEIIPLRNVVIFRPDFQRILFAVLPNSIRRYYLL